MGKVVLLVTKKEIKELVEAEIEKKLKPVFDHIEVIRRRLYRIEEEINLAV